MRSVCDNERLLTGWDHLECYIIDNEAFSYLNCVRLSKKITGDV